MDDADRSAPILSIVQTELPCEFCAEHPQYFPGDPVGFVRAARWAVVVKDCCHFDARVDYLLCDEHWAMIRHQQLPGQCPRCGAIAYSVKDIVCTEIPLGRTVDGAWPVIRR
ncbi:hypothetical protein [Rhodococcus sp. WAY2]|uniref:hypothetical protein n=1 Tax=Rhodococcus sp. WAY2 TaxID=2663121 RepID=UPI00131FC681|nr:hypothetical protein [Rhodococcus sp. WAY2]QHE74443.1 hypothetical protein GFS60_08147 [Rhodococcus sp. WAY2]